jgi:hypothetical protein
VIALAVDPSGQADGLTGMSGAEFAASVSFIHAEPPEYVKMITKGLRLSQRSYRWLNLAVGTKNIARRSVLSAIRSLTYKMHRATGAIRSFGLIRQAMPVGPTPVVRQIIIVIIP